MTQPRTGDPARPRRTGGADCCWRQEQSGVELTTHIHHDMDMDSCAGLSSYEIKRETKFSTSTSGYTASDIV